MSALVVGTGAAYCFRWGAVVHHVPSSWITPADLTDSFTAAVALAHGHLADVYNANSGFISFPGFLFGLLPPALLDGSFHTHYVAIFHQGRLVAGVPQVAVSSTSQILGAGTIFSKDRVTEYAIQPQWFALVMPYVTALSSVALFACDRLAEQLGAGRPRRMALCVAEAVVLWPVVVLWGHPEDAVALGLAVYAVSLVLEKRFVGAGWLLGAAVAVQPLAVVVIPIAMFIGGREQLAGLVVRGVVPTALVVAGPLIANFHATTQSLAKQPTFPLLRTTHVTPWTFLAPRLGGTGAHLVVAGGPTRLVALALVVGAGWLARRWRANAALVVWVVALGLGLRVYFESVLTSYYVWPALAVALVVAALGSLSRFSLAVATAVATTVVAQWHLSWISWWSLDVAGLTVLLVVVVWPNPPLVAAEALLGPPDRRRRGPGRPPPPSRPTASTRAPVAAPGGRRR